MDIKQFSYRVLLAALVLLCFQTARVYAQDFFQTLPDVPLMEGLFEVEDQAVGFDKAGGRILFGTARLGDSLSREQVLTYYHAILPQFGWSPSGKNRFVRGDEILIFSVRDAGNEQFFEITISP